MHLREATAEDGPSLVAALLAAMNWDGRPRFTRVQVLAAPHLAHYVTGWPRVGDFGLIAEDDCPGRQTRAPIGAAWCRQFIRGDPGYGYVDDDVPELTIGVAAAHRGAGVGSALLAGLIGEARTRGCQAISLSVEDGNRARALYERAGFVLAGREGNSDILRLDLRLDLRP